MPLIKREGKEYKEVKDSMDCRCIGNKTIEYDIDDVKHKNRYVIVIKTEELDRGEAKSLFNYLVRELTEELEDREIKKITLKMIEHVCSATTKDVTKEYEDYKYEQNREFKTMETIDKDDDEAFDNAIQLITRGGRKDEA